MFYEFARMVVRPIVRLVWSPEVHGEEHIPEQGPVILASNHLAGCDTVFMPCLIRRSVHFLGKSSLFTGGPANRALGVLMRALGVMPISRSGGSASRAALEAGLTVLGRGQVLGIYPEGSRSPDGRLYRGKTGIARIALTAQCPVVPVAMIGSLEAQRGRFLPRRRPRIRIVFGPALDPLALADASGASSEGARLRAVTDAVMDAIGALSGQERVAEYAADAKKRLRAAGEQGPDAEGGRALAGGS